MAKAAAGRTPLKRLLQKVGRSNSAKGAYYKNRTKKWLEGLGYQVAFMERMIPIPSKTPGGRMFFVKKDQFGADLLAMSRDVVALVQVKLGRKNISAARTEFAKFTFPSFMGRWIVVWEPRDRKPELIDVGNEEVPF